jgi:hypothetical protein
MQDDRPAVELDKLTSADWQPYLGQAFRVYRGGSELQSFELLSVTPLGEALTLPGAARRAPFSLIFRGPREGYLPQRIYRIEHDRMGALEIFLVPIGPDQYGMRYEAIFN